MSLHSCLSALYNLNKTPLISQLNKRRHSDVFIGAFSSDIPQMKMGDYLVTESPDQFRSREPWGESILISHRSSCVNGFETDVFIRVFLT